jgi:hypothetical protein
MGGWVKKWYMKAICRLEVDSVSRDSRETGDGESLEEGTDRDKRDVALVYTRRHTRVMRSLGCFRYLKPSLNNPPTREKFRLMSTVWFVLQEPIASLWRGIEAASWERLCAELFGFNDEEIRFDQNERGFQLMHDPTGYDEYNPRDISLDGTMYGLLDETKRHIPEPIVSHRVARIALSCMRYLHRQDHNNHPTQDNLLGAWATKSRRSPWLWRQRIRVTSIGRRQPTLDYDGAKYPFPHSLRRPHQMLYSKGIQSEDFYLERHIFYMWTLDLLYHTLRAAMKSDELTKALSKPFVSSAACILFPLRIKRVQEAVDAYLEKVGRRGCLDLRVPTDVYDSSLRRVWKPQE